jgi:hypothetical protein
MPSLINTADIRIPYLGMETMSWRLTEEEQKGHLTDKHLGGDIRCQKGLTWQRQTSIFWAFNLSSTLRGAPDYAALLTGEYVLHGSKFSRSVSQSGR